MQTQEIVDAWRREAIEEGVELGRAHALIDFYEARFGPIPRELRAVIEDMHDERTLRAWTKLVATCGAADFAAVVSAFRAS